MTSQYIPELVERVAWVAPMTTLADEIARAAVHMAHGPDHRICWGDGFQPMGMPCTHYGSRRAANWRWAHPKEFEWAIAYARGHLDATMPLQAPRKPPQQPQAPEGGMMGEFW